MDICVAPDMNPDTKPEALQCAREESAAIMASFKDALDAASWIPTPLSTTTAIPKSNPSRSQACGFVREWKQWDGVDGRWDNDKTRAAFRETLTTAFTAEKSTKDLCANGASIQSPDHLPDVKVENPWCPGLSSSASASELRERPLKRKRLTDAARAQSQMQRMRPDSCIASSAVTTTHRRRVRSTR